MNRFSSQRGDEIHYSLWLVLDSAGGVKMTRGEPTTGRGEVAMALSVKAPMSLFRKPLLRAQVQVPSGLNLSPGQALEAVVQAFQASDFDIDVEIKEAA